ncbi:MAG: VWA domain-containing protein [Gammaproteobacteria bacterium]|nr:VWA domain-containing protein [Gammaproteobacteria bacterium]
MTFSDFHFLRPLWLLLLLPWAVLFWRLWQHKVGSAFWQQICDPALIPYVVAQDERQRNRRQLLPYALGGLCGILAMSGPTIERQLQPVFREQAALVILLDLSRSMDATDIAPSRIARARFKIKDLLTARVGGQTALAVFSDQPYVVSPLTNDARTVEGQLSILTPDLMPSQGSDIPGALKQGIELLHQAGYSAGELLLLTDGISRTQLSKARNVLKDSGARLSVLGVGTTGGAPIPQPEGGFITDSRGGIVISKLEAGALTELAQMTQGIYLATTTNDQDINTLVQFFERDHQRREASQTEFTASQWRDLGPWLLIPLLGYATLAFRRGISLLLAIAICLTAIRPAQAEWWLTPDQSAHRAFQAQEYARAAERFLDPRWRAVANYRADRFDEVVASLDNANGPEDLYNKGNALARLGRFEEAIAAYDSALKEEPDHVDALHNRQLLQEIVNPPEKNRQDEEKERAQAGREEPPDGGGQNDQGKDGEQQGEEGGSESGMRPLATSDDSAASNSERSNQQNSQDRSAKANNGSNAAGADKPDPPERVDQAESNAPGDQEQALATEQWLRQIPDDPGGLLRRKFHYQYNRRQAPTPSETPW